VDRSILRLATYEMRFMPEVPTGATINEAVELAKKYSTAESPRFVNGVLGALVSAAPEDHR
jgi:N utilization substance protein B